MAGPKVTQPFEMAGIGTTTRQLTAALTTLGCKLNQAETEEIAMGFASGGFEVVEFDSPAEVYVINTCTVTHVADRKSRQLIRQARRLNPDALVVVTGCYANVSADEIRTVDSADLVVPNERKRELVRIVENELGRQSTPSGESGPCTQRARAFTKIQDGCNQFCTYCIVPFARGRERSEPIEAVVDSVNRLHGLGFKEVVMTGVHIGTYGQDRRDGGKLGLADLVRAILHNTTIPRIRLSSIEPQDFTEDLLGLWPSSRLCRHLHLPLQSGCDTVLQRMRRPYSADGFRQTVERIRSRVPGAAITTDIIVGFPSETDDEFRHTHEFAVEIGFAGIHVFKYSARKGTPAARLPGQIPYGTKKERSDALLRIARQSARDFAAHFVGDTLDVLYESRVEESSGVLPEWEGLTDNYLRIVSPHPTDLSNQIHPTRLICVSEATLRGHLLQ